MDTVRLAFWRFLFQAMTLTSAAALFGLIASVLLAHLLGSVLPAWRRSWTCPGETKWLDKTLRRFDQLITCALALCSY